MDQRPLNLGLHTAWRWAIIETDDGSISWKRERSRGQNATDDDDDNGDDDLTL